MLKLISTIVLLTVSLSTYAKTVKPIYVVHVNLGNTQLSENIIREIQRADSSVEKRPVIVIKPNLDVAENPFAVTKWGFEMGQTRINGEIKDEMTPVFSTKMLNWFQSLEDQNIHPEVFIINGHHVLGLGFYSDSIWDTHVKIDEFSTIDLPTRAVYLQTLVKSQQRFPVVKRFFDKIKLAFIGGCEGLANFEPKEFGIYGRALTSEEIRQKYESGQKNLVLGEVSKRTGLAYFKYDLVATYGIDFTKDESAEACIDAKNKRGCDLYAVDRVLPDSGLWNENHPYNMPYTMKRLFPNAYGVFGFNTPSPLRPGIIWETAFNDARRNSRVNNILAPILSDEITAEEKKSLVQNLRIAWTKSTYHLNRSRVSGSITPAFPELDANGIFAYAQNDAEIASAPKFAPYEVRSGAAAVAAVVAHGQKEKSKDDLGEFIKKIETKKSQTKVNKLSEIKSIEIQETPAIPEVDVSEAEVEIKKDSDPVQIAVPYKPISGE